MARARNGADDTRGAVWSALDPLALERIAQASGTSDVEERIEASDEQAIWLLPLDQQAQQAETMRRIAGALLSELEAPLRARDSVLLQRLFRIIGVLVLMGVVLGGVSHLQDAAEERRDLAAGKPWRVSSEYGSVGCTSPQQQCAESPDFFFHTREESNSWVEIDLGARVRFSEVRVVNRRDCCFERAVPLIVEVSDKPENFHEVARRTTSFSSWLASFAPTEARYVRLRAVSRSSLHLAQVRVLR